MRRAVRLSGSSVEVFACSEPRPCHREWLSDRKLNRKSWRTGYELMLHYCLLGARARALVIHKCCHRPTNCNKFLARQTMHNCHTEKAKKKKRKQKQKLCEAIEEYRGACNMWNAHDRSSCVEHRASLAHLGTVGINFIHFIIRTSCAVCLWFSFWNTVLKLHYCVLCAAAAAYAFEIASGRPKENMAKHLRIEISK